MIKVRTTSGLILWFYITDGIFTQLPNGEIIVNVGHATYVLDPVLCAPHRLEFAMNYVSTHLDMTKPEAIYVGADCDGGNRRPLENTAIAPQLSQPQQPIAQQSTGALPIVTFTTN